MNISSGAEICPRTVIKQNQIETIAQLIDIGDISIHMDDEDENCPILEKEVATTRIGLAILPGGKSVKINTII